jgi:NAD(P)H-flavin reductase
MTKVFTRDDVAKHNTVEDFYTIVGNKVYDMTQYVDEHPGGYDLLFRNAGKDSTKDFEAMFHSVKARNILEKYHVGDLDSSSAQSMTSLTPNYLTRFANKNNISSGGGYPNRSNLIVQTNPYDKPQPSFPFPNSRVMGHSFKVPGKVPVLNPETNQQVFSSPAIQLESTEEDVAMSDKKFKKYKLTQVRSVSHDTKVFIFEVANGKRIPLGAGQHIQICVSTKSVDNKPPERIVRKYTPIEIHDGRFEVLIKQYEQGIVSRYIFNMKIGEKIFMRGPFGAFNYSPNKYKSLGMVAAGTGITPMYQIIREVVKNVEDGTKIKLLFANRTEEDILLKSELDSMVGDNLEIHYLLSQPKTEVYTKGRINQDLIKEFAYANSDSMMLLCGPDAFCDLAKEILQVMNHPKSLVHTF